MAAPNTPMVYAPDPFDLQTVGRLLPLSGRFIDLNVGGPQGAALFTILTLQDGSGSFEAIPMVGMADNADNVAESAVVNKLATLARLTAFDGTNFDRLRTLPDNADAQAVGVIGLLGAMTRLQGYNDAGNVWQRLRAQADSADGLATGIGHLATMSHPLGFNGATWDRIRSAAAAVLANFSSLGAMLSTRPGDWSSVNAPAANVRATTTRAAVAGTRHVCTGISAMISAVAGAVGDSIYLRDGASGAGTVLWQGVLTAPVGQTQQVHLTDLNVVGSVNTAMTLEWGAAPGAGNFQTVTMFGYDAA